MIDHINIFKSAIMRGRKQRKKNDERPDSTAPHCEQEPLRRIKFNISKDNLACFLGEKKNHKKKGIRSSASPSKERASSNKNKNTQQLSPNKLLLTPPIAKTECQEIVQGYLNAILRQIEDKGLTCKWEEDHQPKKATGEEEQLCDSSQVWSTFLVNEASEKSYASTMDMYPNNYYLNDAYMQNYLYGCRMSQNECFEVSEQHITSDPRTTIMIRNIPNKYTIVDLADEIDLVLPNTYDFLYLPCDIKNQCNVGYGFINFLTTDYLAVFYEHFQGKRWARFKSEKICNITYARLQGLTNLIEHFQNSKVQKDKKYRPIIREFAQIEHLIKSQQLN